MQLTTYESDQVAEILKWKRDEPSVVSKAFGVAMAPITWLINKIIPEAAIRGVLDFSSSPERRLCRLRFFRQFVGVLLMPISPITSTAAPDAGHIPYEIVNKVCYVQRTRNERMI